MVFHCIYDRTEFDLRTGHGFPDRLIPVENYQSATLSYNIYGTPCARDCSAGFFAGEKNAERAGRSMTGARQMGRGAREAIKSYLSVE